MVRNLIESSNWTKNLPTLITDLETHQLRDKTLVVITSEFGRSSSFDARGRRGHQGAAFTCVLAGGGLKHSGAYGQTDEFSKKIVTDPVSVPDFTTTIFAAPGIDYTKNLYDGDRPEPITDGGKPNQDLFTRWAREFGHVASHMVLRLIT